MSDLSKLFKLFNTKEKKDKEKKVKTTEKTTKISDNKYYNFVRFFLEESQLMRLQYRSRILLNHFFQIYL